MGIVHIFSSGADCRIKSQSACLLYVSGSHGAVEVKIERSRKNDIVDTLGADITPESMCGVL